MPPVPEALESRGDSLARAGREPTLSEPARRLVGQTLPRFFAVGALGFSVDALVFAAFAGAGASDWSARALSLAAATLLTWRLNRRFTFRPSGRRADAEAVRYGAVAFCAQGLNYGLFLLLRAAMPALSPLFALAVSAGSAAGFSFAGQSLLTFRPRALAPAAFAAAGR